MIRPTTPADIEQIVALADGTAVFKPAEIEALREVLDDFFKTNQAYGHRCISLENNGRIDGFLYYAPAAMTDRTWTVWWIAVRKDVQAAGLGKRMLDYIESDIRAHQGRLITIETSSQSKYELTRRFYLKHGYEEIARITDFYADEDSMVVFSKRVN